MNRPTAPAARTRPGRAVPVRDQWHARDVTTPEPVTSHGRPVPVVEADTGRPLVLRATVERLRSIQIVLSVTTIVVSSALVALTFVTLAPALEVGATVLAGFCIALLAVISGWLEWAHAQQRRAPLLLQGLRLTPQDWRYARTLHGEPMDVLGAVASIYTHHSPDWQRPSLRHAHEMVIAASPLPVHTIDEAEQATSLRRAGLSFAARRTLLYTHGLHLRGIIDLFEQVPDLTGDDLNRFSAMAPLSIWARQTREAHVDQYADHLNAAYEVHGERASYYAALGMSEAEQDRMTDEQVPLDTLKAMAALAMDPVP